jgi:hypothetical protein
VAKFPRIVKNLAAATQSFVLLAGRNIDILEKFLPSQLLHVGFLLV